MERYTLHAGLYRRESGSFADKNKTPHEPAKKRFVGSGCHILILKRARSETGEFEHARHGGIESGHVLATCRGEVGCATAAALDELCGSLDEIAGV